MLDEKKEDAPSPWTKRLRRMKDFQDKNSKTWKRNETLLFGGNPGDKTKSPDAPAANDLAYAWGLVKSLETSIYVNNPTALIESRNPNLKPVARLMEAVCEYDIDVADVKSLGNLCLIDCFTSGYGVIVESCETEKSTVGLAGLNEEESLGEDQAQVVKSQEFVWRRLQPRDLLVDPQATLLDLSDARFIALALYPTISELRDTAMFDLPEDIESYPEASEMTRSDKGKKIGLESSTPYSSIEEDPDYKTICVWEVWDKVAHEVVYVTDSHSKEIGKMKWPVDFKIGHRKLYPVTVLAFHPATKGWYPKPEIDLIGPQLVELNQVESMMRKDTVTKWRKYITVAGLLTQDQIAKVNDTSIDNAVLQVDMTELAALVGQQNFEVNFHLLDLRNLIQPLEDIALKRDLPARKQLVEQDIQHIIGYGPGDRGGLPKTRSAREAMMLYQGQQQKQQKRLDAIGDFYRLIYGKHILYLQQCMEVERYTKVVSEVQNLTEFLSYSKDQIQGVFLFDVIPGTSGAKNTEMKKQSEMQMAQTIMPVLQAEGNSVRPVIERLARVNGWKDIDEMFKNVKNEAKMMAAMLLAFRQGKAKPEQVLEQAAKLVAAELSNAELQMVQAAVQGQGAGAPAASNQAIQGRGESITSQQMQATS